MKSTLLLLLPLLSTTALATCPSYTTYANGHTLSDGYGYYYANGQTILSHSDRIYYPNGAVFRDGDATYYPDGKLLQQDFEIDDLYYPNGVVMRHWNGDNYDYNYADGRPFERREFFYYPDGKVAFDGTRLFDGDGRPVEGSLKLTAPVGTYGQVEASVSPSFWSVDVYLNKLSGDGDPGSVIPAAGGRWTPSLTTIVQWPDQNYRPYFIILVPTGHGNGYADIDVSGSWVTCNLNE